MQNLTAEQMKAQSNMINGMSDDQLKNMARQGAGVNPMMANMDPAMMRQASQMMQNMSPEQMANMQKMAQGMMGGGGMPGGGMPGMGAAAGNPGLPTANTVNLTPKQKTDWEGAEKLKNEANTMFKASQFTDASSKYAAAVSMIRLSDELVKTKPGKDTEIACRNNIAMCKLQLKEYDQVLDQCERVLEHDANNMKACYRMSQAAFALAEGTNEAYLQVALKYAEKARQSGPNNTQVKEHFNAVKAMHDTVAETNQSVQEPKENVENPSSGNAMTDKMRSRVKIGGDDSEEDKEEYYKKKEEDEKKAKESSSTAPQQPTQPTAQIPPMNFSGGAQQPKTEEQMKQSMDYMANMDDKQMEYMCAQMKQNPSLMKQQYEAQMGCKLSDEQFSNITGMMNPQMMRMATNMTRENPDLLKQAQEKLRSEGGVLPSAKPTAATQQPKVAVQTGTGTEADPVIEEVEDLGLSGTQPQQSMPGMMPGMGMGAGGMPGMGAGGMMPGMGAGGMPGMGAGGMPGMGDMSGMMNNPMVQEMMKNPEMIKMAQQMMGGGAGGGFDPSKMDPSKMQNMMSPEMKGMMQDPTFLQNTLNMLKSPMGRPQVEQMGKQMGVSADTLLFGLEWLLKIWMFWKKLTSNPIIFYGIIVLIVSYLLYWLGFTKDLLFMMPFR